MKCIRVWKQLTLETSFWEFQVGITQSLEVLGKIVQALCQPPCVWLLSVTGPEVRKERCGRRGGRQVQQAGLSSSPLSAGRCFHSTCLSL